MATRLEGAGVGAGAEESSISGIVYSRNLWKAARERSPAEHAPTRTSHSPEDVKPSRKPAKRGRKKINEELPSDGDIDINTKRKIQNRAAQRAFRDRKEKHLADLEQRVVDQAEQLETFRTLVDRLIVENEALRRGENVPAGQLPSAPPRLPALSETLPSIPSLSIADTSPVLIPSPPQPSFNLDPAPVPPPSDLSQPTFTSAPVPFTARAVFALPPAPGSQQTTQTPLEALQPPADATNMEVQFDFEAPFDLSDAVPLPPLFQSFFDQYSASPQGVDAVVHTSMPGVSGASTPRASDGGYGDEVCPGDDDDEPPALGADKLPCPECDFSVVSCALPLPWRPATIGKEVPRKDVWQSQKAWAKLCSHPLFSQCDVNELCTALRDNTRCSDDGRLVIAKADVCAVFRSIPARARVKTAQDEMSR